MATIEIRKFDEDGTEVMKYVTSNFEIFDFTINTPVTPTPLPEEDSSENILVKIEGNSTPLTLSWKLKPFSSNQITGSGFSGNSATVIEQILGIKNQFRAISINDAYQLAIVDGGSDLITWDGTMTQMTVRFSGIDPINATATFKFMEGTVITLYSIDTPKQPTSPTAATGSGSGEIDMTWVNPTDTGTGNPALTGYRIQYRTGVNDWTSVDFTPSAALETITGLTASTLYEVRVAASTANGVGQFSAIRTATSGS